MAGNAIKGATELALERWRNEDRPAIGTFKYRPPATTPYDPETGKSEPNFAYGYIAEAFAIELDTETLVIADDKAPVALAGIMGGEASAVLADLQNAMRSTPPPWLAKILGVAHEQRLKYYSGVVEAEDA